MEAMPAQRKILVVEDEVLLRIPVCDVLRESGLTVLEAGNADDALDWLRTDRDIQLVFTDVRMPGTMDGLGLARRLRKEFPDVKVILTSAHAPPEPGVVMLIKPYVLNTVVATIQTALDGAVP
jgi:CheY-like chemotaxis protein